MTTIDISCHCGQLNLHFSRPPMTQLICHCQDCRATSKSPFTQVAFFIAEPNAISGEANCVDAIGGSGQPKQSYHCTSCGDFVYADVHALKGLVAVNGQHIHAPFQFSAEAHVWTSQKLAEVDIPDDMPSFKKAPTLDVVLKRK